MLLFIPLGALYLGDFALLPIGMCCSIQYSVAVVLDANASPVRHLVLRGDFFFCSSVVVWCHVVEVLGWLLVTAVLVLEPFICILCCEEDLDRILLPFLVFGCCGWDTAGIAGHCS
jgi:hypothetical protein